MRLFLGGCSGLALYEDEEVTRLSALRVLCMARGPGGRLVAGTDSGSILVVDGDEARVVEKGMGEAVSALAFVGNGQVLAGTRPVGAWESHDCGESWTELRAVTDCPACESWSSPSGPPSVAAIVAHHKDGNTIYFGVEVGGVYRSRDGGKKWFNLAIPGEDVHSMQICPARPERIYVTTGRSERGMGAFCSDDEGFNWRQMGTSNRRQYTMGLAAHPTEPDRVIISAAPGAAATWRGRARCDVYLSTDAGRRFRTVVADLKGGVRRKALVINPRVPSEVVFGTSNGELWYSNDGGESFDQVAEGLGDLLAVVFA
ncbi:MAG: WD40/YVTN/BNR-like repeat-containing protein [Actinomycetota bacterium]